MRVIKQPTITVQVTLNLGAETYEESSIPHGYVLIGWEAIRLNEGGGVRLTFGKPRAEEYEE